MSVQTSPLLSLSELSALRVQAEQVKSTTGFSQKLDSRNAGWLPTSALGSGMDYAESRPYQQGDDPRSINWRLSARSTETYVKNYHMESRPKLCIVLDQRRSMLFGTRKRLKITQALRLASLISIVAEQQQLKTQYVLINDQTQWLGDLKFEEFLTLSNHAVLTNEVTKQTSLQEALLQLTNSNQLKSGSLVYFISDFLDLESEQNKLLAQLQSHCFVQALHIIDPSEIDILSCTKGPKSGGVTFNDINSDLKIDLKENNQKTLQNTINQHFKNIKKTITNSAVNYTQIMSNQESLHEQVLLPLGQ